MPIKIIFSPRCLEYESPGHPESPKRLLRAWEYLKGKGIDLIEPSPCGEEDILLAHSQGLIDSVKSGSFRDADTPNIRGIFEYARLSAGAAIKAQQVCLEQGIKAFSLMRPPGHHAGKDTVAGFCYFNNMAIAVKRALLKVDRAAILDLDCHHGNGTQDIFKGEPRLLFVSLHQSPLYPHTGLKSEGNCLNYPLERAASEPEYLPVLKAGLQKIADFRPSLLGISLGFDTYKNDPLTDLRLEILTYRKIGLMVRQALSAPGFGVLEGGYSSKIGHCLYEFIQGWSS